MVHTPTLHREIPTHGSDVVHAWVLVEINLAASRDHGIDEPLRVSAIARPAELRWFEGAENVTLRVPETATHKR
jgi:hypothetical protein